jgi:hypothetical protein
VAKVIHASQPHRISMTITTFSLLMLSQVVTQHSLHLAMEKQSYVPLLKIPQP